MHFLLFFVLLCIRSPRMESFSLPEVIMFTFINAADGPQGVLAILRGTTLLSLFFRGFSFLFHCLSHLSEEAGVL